MDFSWSPEQRVLRESARDVARDAVSRYGASTDAWMNGFAKEFAGELAAHGWIGMSWPASHGGCGGSPLDRFIVGEVMIAEGAPIAASWFADRQVGPAIIGFGTPDQQRRFLPGILAGESTWCIGMSEPGAGSDVAALRTSARREGRDWVINGQKIWTSFAALADYCYLICRTSHETRPHLGISEIVVPMDAPGITVRPIADMAGGHHFCEVFFDDVRVRADNLVGQEGAAFSQTMRQLEHERGGIDRLVSNRLIYLLARTRADLTKASVRQEVAALETAYHAGRLLVIRESLRQGPAGFSAVSKRFCTVHEQRVAQFAWSTLGMDATGWDLIGRALCYSPSYLIMGGTHEILGNIIGNRILALPR
jgi:alkylation response protein AidB-like acyl-CoA dehydrogenase